MTRSTYRSLRHAVAILAAAGSVFAALPSAIACGGGWWSEGPAIDYRVDGIANAEKDLAEGHYGLAAGKVIRMIPHIHGFDGISKDSIVNRSLRVLAVATMRSGGDLHHLAAELPDELIPEFAGKSAEAHRANLEWSVRTLKALRKAKKDDATLKSELAEAMSQLPETKPKAKKTLEKLAKKDLLTSPEAYRALARLRAERGDESGSAAALERCRMMAKDEGVCTVPARTASVAVDGQS